MRVCLTPECENITEGRTDFCPSCNRRHRKIADERKKEATKREMFYAKSKPVYKKPAKVSDKRKVQNAVYYELKSVFLLEHPECELKLIGCENFSVDVHHLASGSNKATNLNNTNTWKASCRHCHTQLHDKLSAKEARDKGLKV